ncbi:hypothetical protein [Sphingobium sp. BS19]|uniref:hypothetical protein n=1 Tax=Sphingobium sp. BS19 TaxID=3018973 RepID=UPI0022EFAB23|nr:hypothetical protein [Sphingobium sp. BS19]GLJ00171.1 hypothetical protein Sbs19_39880 [Sphingobium sp. BS19]
MSVKFLNARDISVSCAGILLMVGSVSGCGSPKPGGQTVAVVNGEPITQAQLNAEAGDTANTRDKTKRQTALNAALDAIVARKIVAQAAREQGLEKDPGLQLELDKIKDLALIRRFLELNAKTGISAVSDTDINNFLSQNPQLAEARKIIDVQKLEFATPSDPSLMEKIKVAKTMAELQQVLEANGVKVTPSQSKLDTASMSPQLYKAIMTTAGGEPLMLIEGLNAQAVLLTQALDAPLSNEKSIQLAKDSLQEERMTKRIAQQIQSLRGAAKIEYGPGYAAPVKPKF